MEKIINRTIKNLKINRFNAHFVDSRKEAYDLIMSMIEKNSSVGFGGSKTLEEIGILKNLRESHEYELHDRENATLEGDKRRIALDCLSADYFLTGTNGITEDVKLVNIDYRGNRVAALTYGPDKVIVVAGVNKISKDVDEAYERIKNVAVKLNSKKLNWKTPCENENRCLDCKTEKRMCGVVTIHEFQTIKDRINIIIINEEIGF